jgi:ribosome maturation factor RimP
MGLLNATELENRLRLIVEELLPGGDHFIVAITAKGLKSPQAKLTVLIDSDTGLEIDTASTVSRGLSAQLDELDLVDANRYTLEVSSPGVDYPLTTLRQFAKNVGRTITFELTEGKLLEAELIALIQNEVHAAQVSVELKPVVIKKKRHPKLPPLEEPEQEPNIFIPLSHIVKATVQVRFE